MNEITSSIRMKSKKNFRKINELRPYQVSISPSGIFIFIKGLELVNTPTIPKYKPYSKNNYLYLIYILKFSLFGIVK